MLHGYAATSAGRHPLRELHNRLTNSIVPAAKTEHGRNVIMLTEPSNFNRSAIASTSTTPPEEAHAPKAGGAGVRY